MQQDRGADRLIADRGGVRDADSLADRDQGVAGNRELPAQFLDLRDLRRERCLTRRRKPGSLVCLRGLDLDGQLLQVVRAQVPDRRSGHPLGGPVRPVAVPGDEPPVGMPDQSVQRGPVRGRVERAGADHCDASSSRYSARCSALSVFRTFL